MSITLRKIASFFTPKPRKAQRARRSRSSTPETTLSSRSSHGGSTTSTPRDPSVKGSSNVLTRLKSWIERTKSKPCEGFFSVDVGKKKNRYVVPITYLSHENLQKLLDDSVAEFGHSPVGALQLACEEDEFQEVLDTIEKSFEGDNTEGEGERQRLIAGKVEKLH